MFEDEFVLQQLKSSSLLAYVNLIRFGYPKRAYINQIYNAFKPNHQLWRNECSDLKRFCSILLLSNGCESSNFKFGTECIFFRTKCSTLLEKLLKPHPEFISHSLQRMKKYLIRLEWKKAIKKILLELGNLIYIFICSCMFHDAFL